jgi:CheY-like chemotaxis protein
VEVEMKKILVVDDETDFRIGISMELKRLGFDPIEADNGTDAFDLAISQHPDLIVSDVVMDNANGFMLRELLRENIQTATIPLILMTGHADEAGAWESDPEVTYLKKPFSIPELVSTITQKLQV